MISGMAGKIPSSQSREKRELMERIACKQWGSMKQRTKNRKINPAQRITRNNRRIKSTKLIRKSTGEITNSHPIAKIMGQTYKPNTPMRWRLMLN